MKLDARAKAFRKPNTRTMKREIRSVISARKRSLVPSLILQTLHPFFRKKKSGELEGAVPRFIVGESYR